MSSFYFLFALVLTISHLSQASFPYAGFYGDYPMLGYYGGIADPYSYAPFAYGNYLFGYPYAWDFHYYHPRAALRNIAKSFHRENGHLSDTSMISPFAKAHKKI